MRIVVLAEWFTEKMGYVENCLPRALAALGHDVHVVAPNVQPYFSHANFRETYGALLGPPVVPCGVKQIDGYTLHRLPHGILRSRAYPRGLVPTLRELRPQVVQSFDILSWGTFEAAATKPLMGYALYTGNHICASVFPLASQQALSLRQRLWVMRSMFLPGRLVSLAATRCYPATQDCEDIAIRFFGVPREKCRLAPLGVDTERFVPPSTSATQAERERTRAAFGFRPGEIVCVYTGRFTSDKNPMLLAAAVAELVRQGEPFRGLFIGSGPSSHVQTIASSAGCVVHPLVPVQDLPPLYWAADIACWPTQESTSMLDAAACGLPIVVSDRVAAVERYQGNGLTYREGDVDDLVSQLLELKKLAARRRLGDHGALKMQRDFSWLSIAERRVEDYRSDDSQRPAGLASV